MKILTFTDLHIGKKNSNDFYYDLDKKVIDVIYEKSKEVDMVVFCGDMFHNRSSVNSKNLLLFRYFLDKFDSLKIPIKLILGNHDIFYNNRKDINYYDVFSGLYKNIEFITNMKNEKDILFVGWLHDEQIDEYNKISENYKWIFGHFEFSDIKINDVFISTGIENKNKKSFILSGHYHKRIVKDKIIYIGTPYSYDWNGKNSKDFGYCIIDTNFEKIEFFNLDLYHFIEYNLSDIVDKLDKYRNEFKNNEIRIIVDKEMKVKELSDIKLQLNTFGATNLILENGIENKIEDKEIIKYNNLLMKTPIEFIDNYFKELNIEEDKKKRIEAKIKNILINK